VIIFEHAAKARSEAFLNAFKKVSYQVAPDYGDLASNMGGFA
jgi:hypothetical protein